MRKIALGILGAFMLLGGVVLSACTGSTPSLSVSSNYIEIYTNDSDKDNYQSGSIDVTLNNSDDGIGVQVESGSDVVTYSIYPNSSSSYTVTLQSIKSGDARVKIYSRENQSVYEYVNVKVLTVATSTSLIDQNDSSGRTSMYVVKNGSGTSLDADKYITFEPIDANVKDVVWSFDRASVVTTVTQSDGAGVSNVAEIRDGRLFVYDAYTGRQISVYAIINDDVSLTRELTFQVIEDSSILSFSVNGNDLVVGESDVTIPLIRNNSGNSDTGSSSVTGRIVVSTFDENMTITPRAFLKESGIEVNYQEYFKFTVTERTFNNSMLTMNFTIDALYDDFTVERKFGELYFDLVLNYSEYTYSISTRDELANEFLLNLSFVPDSVVVRDSSGNDVGGNIVDIYSQYYNTQGYLVACNVYPDDIPLSDSSYMIRIDIVGFDNVDDVLEVFNRSTGVKINFNRVSGTTTTYLSEPIQNGTQVYLRAGTLGGELSVSDFRIDFVASGNPAIAYETIIANLYHISMGSTMQISEVFYDGEGGMATEENYATTKYISSARNDLGVADSKEYFFKIDGISSSEGLSLRSGTNSNFTLTMEEYDHSMPSDAEQYVIVKVTVTLNNVEFRDSTYFSFSHRAGLNSGNITLEAFTPLTSVSIFNDSRGANNVYDEVEQEQGYLVSNGEIVVGDRFDNTLSSILMSAGSNISLLFDYQNATLNTATNAGYKFSYLDYSGSQLEGTIDDAYNYFINLQTEDLTTYNFVEGNNYFTFSNGQLNLNNGQNAQNGQFVIYVKVEFYGYDENHDDVTLVRFFRLESFYPVTSLRSNISETELLSWETLSNQDEELSQVDVTVTLRNDSNLATYSDLSYFKVILGTGTSYVTNDNVTENATLRANTFENMVTLADVSYIYNDYLLLTNFRVVNNELRFNIRAQSTKLQSVVNEMVSVLYEFKDRVYPEVINVKITQVDRVEEVVWLNETSDSQIYLNVASEDVSERTFTINTSVGPSEAYNRELSYYYQPMDNNQSILEITTSAVGQTFTLSIHDNSQGGWGYLYLLPSDMIKIEGGVQSAIIYNLVDGVYTADYLPLDEIHTWVNDLYNGENGRLDYFLNNNNEKVYYRDIIIRIRVTVADGQSEETAVRIYDSDDFAEIKYNPRLYYRVMNDITLGNWESIDAFSGMIFGNTENITINLSGESLVGTLSGVIKDLTIKGSSDNGAFVANMIMGDVINISSYIRPTVENVNVDVVFDSEKGAYTPSTLSGSYENDGASYTGGIASINAGNIINCNVYGLTIDATNAYVGGIAGYSYGTIQGSAVEFYNFADGTNTFSGNIVGGLVGYFGANSANATISNSYVYAFNLNAGTDPAEVMSYSDNITAREFRAIAGTVDRNGTNVIEKSFAFMGDCNKLVADNSNVTIRNSYITYYQSGTTQLTFWFYDSIGNMNYMTYNDLATADWSGFDNTIWETENISSEINFGFAYLKDVTQTAKVSVEQTIQTVAGKSLSVDGGVNGILFHYDVKELVTNSIANGELRDYNTISISELFGVTEKESESLLISVNRQDYAYFSNSTIVTQKTTDSYSGRVITLSLVSRTDFSDVKTFNIMILNAIPTFSTSINGVEIRDNQIVNIQTGLDNAGSVSVVVDDGIYLYGARYTLTLDDYTFINTFENNGVAGEEYFDAQVIGNTIVYEAEKASNNNYVSAKISLGLQSLANNSSYASYLTAVEGYNTRTISLSSYDGANSLIVDSKNLSMKPLETAIFNATLNSDRTDDGLDIKIGYQDDIFELDYTDENNGSVTINDNLKLDFSITSSGLNFNVLMSVNKDYRHKVDKDYNLVIYVRPESQTGNDNLLRTIDLLVQKQTIENVNVTNYTVNSRQLHNSKWYYNKSEQVTSVITPGTETILSLEVNPNFAHMTNFKVSYTLSNAQAGSVSISRMLYNQNYGYYIDTSTTESLNLISPSERGLMVTPTDTDLRNGLYYFRLYVSSSFTANSVITLTFTFYDGTEVLSTSTNSYYIDYLQEAAVLVNGETSIRLAKSQSATVTVNIGSDQTLDRIYLNGQGSGITLTEIEEVRHDTYITYTAHINTSVLSTLANGESTGSFTVVASVVSYVNGIATYKYSYATIYLVDFTAVVRDQEGVSINSSNSTTVYNGTEYDSFVSYINASSILSFSYQINPASYNYNTSNNAEVEAVNEILSKRNEFLSNGTYADINNSYYINYKFNSQTNQMDEVSLRERLFYVNSDGSGTSIYNSVQGSFLANSTFDFIGGTDGNQITIKGKQSGSVLLRLVTYVTIGNSTFEYNYDFVVRISVWSDEEVPIPIYTASEFLQYLNGNPDTEGNTEAGDYILMNDIVLTNYTPTSTQYFNSLDGNGYTIYLNSFNFNNNSTSLNLALFSEVTENSTIKNVRVNIYNGGKLTVNINQYNSSINIAGFALTNNGIIYNCDVVAFYDVDNSLKRESGATGLVVTFVIGNGGQATDLTTGNIAPGNINIAGFVLENNNVITNSRVGGETYKYIREEFDESFYDEMDLPLFTIQGQGYVSGFVNENSGTISASFASNIAIINSMRTTLSQTAGFVRDNNGEINTSYVKGAYDVSTTDDYHYDNSSISTTGNVGGFVYSNSGTIKNSYVNFAIEIDETRSYLAAGFVYENNSDGIVTLSFAQVKMSETNSSYINNMYFSGVDQNGNSLNQNASGITYCYYFADERDVDIQANYDIGAYAISTVDDASIYYRFSFTSEENAVDGIWMMLDDNRGITLASADHIAFSNRYIVYRDDNNEEYDLFYSTLRDYDTRAVVDLSYGSLNNPIIIRDSEDFAKATGKATDVEITSYSQYYNDNEVFGNYRFVSDIDFSAIDQNLTDNNSIKLTTTTKDFSGILDGNGFTITNMVLEASDYVENYGLFARINGGSILNIGLEVASVHNGNAAIVGTLAGTVIDGRLMGISLYPVSSRDEEDALVAISIHGNNIVGGVVGAVFGNSKISDITIEDIDVAANYYEESKGIDGNGDNFDDNIRSIVAAGGSIANSVSTLSYAGGLVGYADIYNYADEEDVIYKGSVDYSTYDIMTVRIYNSINIYGEVAGGIIGYMSGATIGYDLGLELDADMSLTTPSYIIAKNLYAGGIVGESYGGLFACYAEYSRDLQDTIEENMYSYFNGSTSAERGQLSIFSYTQEENNETVNRNNNPYYVGGLVGYAGAGYISTSYNRLNVVSNNSTRDEYTSYFGGIVGGVNSDYYYRSDVMLARSQVSYFLDEVYFSGVLNSTDSSSANMGGAIGYVSTDSIVAMKKVNTMPYYELDSNRSKIFALIGGFETSVDESGAIEITKPSHLYFIDNMNGHYDLITSSFIQGGESVTTSIAVSAQYLAQNDVTTNDITRYNYIFGYRDLLINVENPGSINVENTSMYDIDNTRIMQVEWMRDLPTMDLAYTKMNQYFLRNDWNANYWEHEVNTLYPRIVLTPRSNVVFLDAYDESIESVLTAIQNNSSMTVVVRGMSEPDSLSSFEDVDLREYMETNNYAISNFTGKFVSYEEYMNSNDMGRITKGYEVVEDGEIIGGTEGEKVGLILDRPLFNSIDLGFEMTDLNLYFISDSEDDDVEYSSLLVQGTATNGRFERVDVHLKGSNITLKASTNGYAGLLTSESVSTDFINVNIIFRRDSAKETQTITFKDTNETSPSAQYFGILAGRMTQNSLYKSMTISNINFAVEKILKEGESSTDFDDDATPAINFEFIKGSNYEYNLYFGLLAGDSTINAEANTSTFRMTSLNNYIGKNYEINISLRNESSNGLNNAYVGAYFGSASFTYIEGTLGGDYYPLNNITINQGVNANNEYLGLGFGRITGNGMMSVSANVETTYQFTVAGAINQTAAVETAYIGGLIGDASMNIQIGSTVSTEVEISGLTGTTYASIGSLVGRLTGSFGANSLITGNTLTINNGNGIDVDYGAIGRLSGSGSVIIGAADDGSTLTSNDEVTINNGNNVNIGGIVGNIDSDSTSNVTIQNYINSSKYNLSCENMIVGGVIGNSNTAAFNVTSSGFGGTLYVLANENGYDLAVGGIVGSATKTTTASLIDKAYCYGDVFVDYTSTSAVRLASYYFGGAVGKYDVSSDSVEEENKTLSVTNSYSLMSSFNDRITSDIVNYGVNAFVGYGSESINFNVNYYASGVTFATQTDKGNTDTYYAYAYGGSQTPTYYGYTKANDDLTASDSTNINIVETIRNNISDIIGGTDNLNTIKKLNPVQLTEEVINAGEGIVNNKNISFDNSGNSGNSGNVLTTGINWFYLASNLGGGDSYINSRIQTLNNAVIVGNGQTVNFASEIEGSEVGETPEGENYGFVEQMSTGNGTFSAVSNLVIYNNINVVATSTLTVGGLVGYIGGSNTSSSILYAVGVNGNITVGGTGDVNVGGIVGGMRSDAMINNAYFDGDIYYTAGKNGSAYGICYSQAYLEILNTFSAGAIHTYSPPTSVALFNGTSDVGKVRIYDSYTIMQHFSKDYGQGIFNGTAGVRTGTTSNFFNDSTGEDYAVHSVGYGGRSYAKQSLSVSDSDTPDEESGVVSMEETETRDLWFYSPYKNYGYATTGFGFLRNITIYNRDSDTESGGVVNYTYTAYAIEDIKNITSTETAEYFYTILNETQFNAMLAKMSDTYSSSKQFMLRYDISWAPTTETNFAAGFNLDGRSNTLKVDSDSSPLSTALFSTINGTIENLNITGYNGIRSGAASTISAYGALTDVVSGGTLKNVAVSGTLDVTDTYKVLGGVVGVAIESEITAVESTINLTLKADQSNSIIGGIVGYANNETTISYSSNATNVQVTQSYARGDSASSGNDLPTTFSVAEDGTLSATDSLSITTSNAGNGSDVGEYSLESVVSSVLGGVVGVLDGGTVDHSYNTASVINGYQQFTSERTDPYQVGTVLAGGVVGYSALGTISNSFNAGYVVAGNMYNYYTDSTDDSKNHGYPALAGGIVAYAITDGANKTIDSCYNDGKVQAVSYLDNNNNYEFSVTNPNINVPNNSSSVINFDLTYTITYNQNDKNRLVFAYGLGYVNGGNVSGASGENAEIVNDGNIGYIKKSITKTYTVQRYGGDRSSPFGAINEKYTFEGDPVASGYDAYGFPNRFNQYYTYSFDLNVFNGISFWGNTSAQAAAKITIDDNNFKGDSGNDTSAINVSAEAYNENSAAPGGETQYYLSIPLYDANGLTGYDGYSYEEYVYRLNNSDNTCNTDYDLGGDINDIYNQIVSATSSNAEERRYNINGSIFSVAYNGNQLAAYTRGYGISGTIDISGMPSVTKNDAQLSRSSIKVSNMNFTLEADGEEVVIDPLSYSTYITGNTLHYTVYYDKDTLKQEIGDEFSSLNISATYDLEFTFKDALVLSTNNIVKGSSGNRVIFKMDYYNSEGVYTLGNFGDYFESIGVSDIQDSMLKVEFDGLSEELKNLFYDGNNNGYYIDYYSNSNSPYYQQASFAFDSKVNLDKFFNYVQNNDVTMTFYYNVNGEGNYESADIINNVTNITQQTITETYIFGVEDEYNEVSSDEHENYFSFGENKPEQTVTITLPDETTAGAVKYEIGDGASKTVINFYPTITGDGRIDYNINSAGTNIAVSVDVEGDTITFTFEGDSKAYDTFVNNLGSATKVSVASKIEDESKVNTITIPTTIPRTYGEEYNSITAIYKLQKEDGYTYEEDGSSTKVTKNDGTSSNVYVATYKFDSFDGYSGDGQLFTYSNTAAVLNNTFAYENADGDTIGIRDKDNGITYEFSTGNGTINGLNSSGYSYTLTEITYDGGTLNIYRLSDGDYTEIREYILNDYNIYYECYNETSPDTPRTIIHNVSMNLNIEIDTKISDMFLVNPNSAFGNFENYGISNFDLSIGGQTVIDIEYALCYIGLYTGDIINPEDPSSCYKYNNGNPIYYDSTTGSEISVGTMVYVYDIETEESYFVIFDIDSDSVLMMKVWYFQYNYESNWFTSAPNFYFVAENITDNGDGTQTIVFDESRLAQILADDTNNYNHFEVKQYGKVPTTYNLSLYYGNDTASYTLLSGNEWETVIIGDDLTYDQSADTITVQTNNSAVGQSSGSVTFKTTKHYGEYSEDLDDSDMEEIKNMLNNTLDASEKPNIILGFNIYYNGNMELKNNSIYGDGHILNVYGNMSAWQNLISLNEGASINNVKFAFVVDLSEFAAASTDGATEGGVSTTALESVADGTVGESETAEVEKVTTQSLINLADSSELSDVSLFGSIRNINANSQVVSSGNSVNMKDVYVIYSESAESTSGSAELKVESYLTIQSNSASKETPLVVAKTPADEESDDLNGATVGVRINFFSNTNANVNITSKTYVVLGDGENGSNGADATDLGASGSNGGNGGKSGTTTITSDASSDATWVIYSGADGVGGNGGNGADGKNAEVKNSTSYTSSLGGGGGGAFGFDGVNYTIDSVNNNKLTWNNNPSESVLSNRRNSIFTVERTEGQITALAGSGGTGGLGVVYANAAAYRISKGFDVNGGDNGKYYYIDGNKYGVVTWYITAAGGGAAGGCAIDSEGVQYKGGQGSVGNYFSPTYPSALRNGVERGVGIYQSVPPTTVDYNTKAYIGYYWSDDHETFGDEFLFGNLQYISIFSHWYDASGNVVYGDYATSLKSYINNNSNWKTIFYGGIGGINALEQDEEGEDEESKIVSNNLSGGTPYTTEIYGYYERVIHLLISGCKDQYYFSRSDMVTRAGSFGTAAGVANPFNIAAE